MKKFMSIFSVLLFSIFAPLVGQQFTVWHSPLTFSTNNANLSINPAIPDAAIRVTTAVPGDLQWINLGLVIPSNVQIDSVFLCYELNSSASFISQVRLTQMTTPNTASVLHDDPTDLTNPGPTCYSSDVLSFIPSGTITLELRLNFGSVSDWINIGAIGIVVSPVTTYIQANQNSKLPDVYQLKQNYPNPFNPNTIIEFYVPHKGIAQLVIYNTLGQLVRTLINEERSIGSYQEVWDGKNDQGNELSSGTYFYQLRIGDFVSAKRMVLLK